MSCELPDFRRIAGAKHSLAYRTVPATVRVGEAFVVEVATCPSAPLASANASMPEHRHGMNYKPSIRGSGDGRFRVEGWVFHMPGRWEFAFEAGGERFTDSLRLE